MARLICVPCIMVFNLAHLAILGDMVGRVMAETQPQAVEYEECPSDYAYATVDDEHDPNLKWGYYQGKSCKIWLNTGTPDPVAPNPIQPNPDPVISSAPEQPAYVPPKEPVQPIDPSPSDVYNQSQLAAPQTSSLSVNPVLPSPTNQTTMPRTSGSDEYPGVVGIYYTVWHTKTSWGPGANWGTPLGGGYESKDEERIKLHAQWVECSGVDYILVDWSNNMDYTYPNEGGTEGHIKCLEDATIKLFEVLNKIGSKLKVAIMIGHADGNLAKIQNKITTINTYLLNSPENKARYFHYKGAPLLVKYQGVTGGSSIPEHLDCAPGFTVRSMSAFLTQQVMPNTDNVGYLPHWSWEDRVGSNVDYVVSVDPHDPSVHEATVVTPGCRGEPVGCATLKQPWLCPMAQGRQEGTFLTKRVDNAVKSRVPMMLVGTFNEFVRPNEHENAELSKDFEPSVELGYGPLEQLRSEISRYKAALGASAQTCPFQQIY